MRVELSTSLLDIIVPDTYGSEFQYNVREDMWEDFKQLLVKYAEEYLNDALKDTLFENAKLSDFTFHSPQFYNYSTDWINFTMDFDDKIVDEIRNKADDNFYAYLKKKFKSCDGYTNFMPENKEEFLDMLSQKPNGTRYKFEKAICAWILYEFEKENDPDEYQRAYLDSVWEYASGNGYEEDDEDEETI